MTPFPIRPYGAAMISQNEIYQARILIVDDQPVNVELLEFLLNSTGYKAVSATTDPRVVAGWHATHRYDLIILDLQMPVMDGWRFIELLHCYVKLSTIPVIVVTAASSPHLERIKHEAVRGCLQAPYELRALLKMVDSCLYPALEQRSLDTA